MSDMAEKEPYPNEVFFRTEMSTSVYEYQKLKFQYEEALEDVRELSNDFQARHGFLGIIAMDFCMHEMGYMLSSDDILQNTIRHVAVLSTYYKQEGAKVFLEYTQYYEIAGIINDIELLSGISIIADSEDYKIFQEDLKLVKEKVLPAIRSDVMEEAKEILRIQRKHGYRSVLPQ